MSCRITYPGSGLYVNQDYLVTGEMTKIRENGATSGIGVLATFGYDDLGRRTSLTFGNGASQSYSFDAVSRLASLTANLSGTTNDLTIGSMSYNPASQIVSQNRSNDSYAWTGHGSGSTASVANGLNQLTNVGGSATSHDARGNLTSDPTTGKTYGYSSENLLTSASGGVTLAYDPQLRLYQVAGAATTRFAYDGVNMIAEYNGSNALQRRFVFGPGVDEPLVQYEGTGTTDRRFLHADERGSIVAISDGTGAMLTINKYDEFGKPQSGNSGRFQYTGQAWLPEVGLYYYKARMYAPHIGRFMQTDPIGYEDTPNPYAYVLNDPVNLIDPLGLCIGGGGQNPGPSNGFSIVCPALPNGGGSISAPGVGGANERSDAQRDIVITAPRLPRRQKAPTPPRLEEQRERWPSQCQIDFLKDQLSRRGLPTSQLDTLKFVEGADYEASWLTRLALNGGAVAVTQGSTVYVQPAVFDFVADFRTPTTFEEAYHSAQFAMNGNAAFYTHYGLAVAGGIISGLGGYGGNVYEAFAKGASNEMFAAYKNSGC